MEHRETEPLDQEIDAVMRRSRPVPDARWVGELEQGLLPTLLPTRIPSVALFRLPHFRLGAVVAAGLAALLLALGLAGVGPLGGQAHTVRAKDDCEKVQVTRVERVPIIVVGRNGKERLVTQPQQVRRYESRCR
jgi:hypothetical protein